MSVYEASFVRARTGPATSFRETARILREANESWLAASPTNVTWELTVRLTEGSDWVSIQASLADQQIETLSRELGTTAIRIYMSDEMVLRFSYGRFDHGQAVRSLEYADGGDPRAGGTWTKVEGEPEPWEALLFSPRLLELYRKYAPDELPEGSADRRIKPGLSIPWVCEADVVAEIARALQLPWAPIGNGFPPATHTKVIPGSPERWKAFRRRHRRSWWRFWA